jgi:hypothetical protein
MTRKNVLIPTCAALAVLVAVFAGLWISNLTHNAPSKGALSVAHSTQASAPSSTPSTSNTPSTAAATPGTPAAPAATPSTPAAVPGTPSAPAPALSDPVAVVTQFYADITNGDYSDAWALGGDNIGGSSYSGWVAGYSTTASITVSSSGMTGSDTVWADISAAQDDGSVKTYRGTYTVMGGVITSADIVQTS